MIVCIKHIHSSSAIRQPTNKFRRIGYTVQRSPPIQLVVLTRQGNPVTASDRKVKNQLSKARLHNPNRKKFIIVVKFVFL